MPGALVLSLQSPDVSSSNGYATQRDSIEIWIRAGIHTAPISLDAHENSIRLLRSVAFSVGVRLLSIARDVAPAPGALVVRACRRLRLISSNSIIHETDFQIHGLYMYHRNFVVIMMSGLTYICV